MLGCWDAGIARHWTGNSCCCKWDTNRGGGEKYLGDGDVVRNELEKKEEKDYKGQEEERGCGVGGLMGNGRGRMATVDGASI